MRSWIRNRATYLFFFLALICAPAARAQDTSPLDSKKLYQALKTFRLGGKRAPVQNLVLHEDRVDLTFTDGIFYFSAPIGGKIYAVVFIGNGKFHADPPPNQFEKGNLQRLFHATSLDSDFKTAVMCFTDAAAQIIQKATAPGDIPLSAEAQRLATAFEPQTLKETGINIAGRVSISLLNQESPGVFIGQFDKGHRGKFTYVLDPQTRIPTGVFGLNAGEKGVIFRFDELLHKDVIWMSFYSQSDYAKGIVEYSENFDEIAIRRHDMDIDMSAPADWLKYTDQMEFDVLQDGLRAIQLTINEDLGLFNNVKLNDSLRIKSLSEGDGTPVDVIQEDWDSSLTVFLPTPSAKGQKLTFSMRFEGHHNRTGASDDLCIFPVSNSWYPRHGYRQRSTYRLVIHHRKRETTVGPGEFSGDAAPDSKGLVASEWRMDTPVPDTMFGVGNFRRYVKPFKGEETSIPFDYYWIENPTGTSRAPNNDFIAAEMSNSIQYYGLQFGIYPFGSLHGIYTCQQTGLPSPITNNSSAIPRTSATMLLLPGRSVDFAFAYGFNARRLAFISEGIGRQWWGNAVDLRSYRDDWLREGLPFYFSLLYTGQRDSLHSLVDMIDTMHAGLRAPPTTLQGIGSGRIADVGSIIGGRRLDTIDTTNAYSQLVVGKGALVIRMLHFLFTDPGTRDDKAFFAMMQDFFMRYSGKAASTEDFLAVANEHFVDTPIAKKFALADLGWFFRQWVYTTHLPTYRLLYHLESNPDGSAVLKGKLYQEDVPADEKWFMPIPLVMTYGKDKEARGVIAVLGGEQDVTVDVPQMPDKVELDPELFVLSAKSIAQKDH